MMAKVALECGGDISASQEDILANSPFLGAANAPSASQARGDEEEEEEVFATPPELPQQEPITMCSLPFTPSPSQPHSPSPPPSDDDDAARPRRKPRVCTRKVRGSKTKISTPAPSPTPTPSAKQQPEQPPRAVVDPLYRALLMIPTATAAAATTSKQDPLEDFLALARQRGIF